MNHTWTDRSLPFFGFLALVGAALLSQAGPLDPPVGPVAPSYKTLTAVEPRVEISAINTPGDADSMFKIISPGSYYLSGNVAGVAGKMGIEIAASNVTIDMRGFTMRGVAGSLKGVFCASGFTNPALENGAVAGWELAGVDFSFSTGARVSSVTARNNNSEGIAVGPYGLVTACTAEVNGGRGIRALNVGCTIDGCKANNNTLDGIGHGGAGTVRNCTASGNSGSGITCLGASVITNCTSWANLVHGFDFGNCVMTGCDAQSNTGAGFNSTSISTIRDCQALGNTGDGFVLQNGSLISQCTSAQNLAGIHVLGGRNRLEGNTVSENVRGLDVDGTGNIIVRNTASGNGGNYSIVAGNVGQYVVAATAGVVNGSSGGTAPGSADPSVNFSY